MRKLEIVEEKEMKESSFNLNIESRIYIVFSNATKNSFIWTNEDHKKLKLSMRIF